MIVCMWFLRIPCDAEMCLSFITVGLWLCSHLLKYFRKQILGFRPRSNVFQDDDNSAFVNLV